MTPPGNIFIADFNNNEIREVNIATGIITTVAGDGQAGSSGNGGAATAAELNHPQGVAVDSSGNIFIADTSNQVIRKVSGGTITTVAGNGSIGLTGNGGLATSAELNTPTSVAVDANGDLFIADTNNNEIREVSAATLQDHRGRGQRRGRLKRQWRASHRGRAECPLRRCG